MLSAAVLPWSFKPLYGLCSDAFPIFGQHRKPYLILASLLGLVAWSALAFLAAGGGSAVTSSSAPPTGLLVVLLVLSSLSTALSDVIVDAMVAERSGEAARKASAAGLDGDAAGTEGENALQSLCWGSLSVGGLAGSGIGMIAASSLSVSHIFLLSASCPALGLLASQALTEVPPADSEQTVGGVTASTGTSTGGPIAAVKAQVVALLQALRNETIWKPLLFFWLQNALVPSPGQAMMFFSTDVLGFTQEFMSLQGVLAFTFLLLGTWVYSRYVQGIGFLRLFLWCQLAAAAISLLDLALVSRANLALGIPDKFFVLGSDALGTVLNRLTMQPFLVIAGRLCPSGCEAALFACFMSTCECLRVSNIRGPPG